MTSYGFYSKVDKKKEIISSVRATNLEQAVEMLANRKRLTPSEFEKLYEVIEK